MTTPAPSGQHTTLSGADTVRAIAAITSIADDQSDVIEPGAIAASLVKRGVKLCVHHDQKRRIGQVTSAVELLPGDRRLPADCPSGAGALRLTGRLNLATQAGRRCSRRSASTIATAPGPSARWRRPAAPTAAAGLRAYPGWAL